MINKCMYKTHAQAVQNAFADLARDFDGDLVYALNTENSTESYASLSKKISQLFYKLECEVYGYKKRETYKRTCRIQRLVAIERKNDRAHAHILVKRFGNYSDEMISTMLSLAWHEINGAEPGTTKQYLINTVDNTIRDQEAVSAYITKDVAFEISRGNDVIDDKSSFIR